MKRFQLDQLATLWALRSSKDGAFPWRSAREVARSLGRSQGAVRHRLMRYARKGWLLRLPYASGHRYQLLSRGTARLDWLKAQADSEDPVGSFFKTLLD